MYVVILFKQNGLAGGTGGQRSRIAQALVQNGEILASAIDGFAPVL